MADPSLFDAASMPTHPARRTITIHAPALGSLPPIQAQLDSENSVEAGIANMPRRSGQRERVRRFLERCGPHTDAGIAEGLNMAENSARPRRKELQDAGVVVAVGKVKHGNGHRTLWGLA